VSAVAAGFAAQFDYVLVFGVDAGTTLLTALITAFLLAETRPRRVTPATAGLRQRTGLRTVFRDRVFLVFIGLNLFAVLLWLGCAAVGALVALGQLASGPARERRAATLRGTAEPMAGAEVARVTQAATATMTAGPRHHGPECADSVARLTRPADRRGHDHYGTGGSGEKQYIDRRRLTAFIKSNAFSCTPETMRARRLGKDS
jgi:hypothetical protein